MQFDEINIFKSEYKTYWSASAILSDVNTYKQINIDDNVTINLNGEIYNFIVISKEKKRLGTDIYFQISFVSTTVKLAAPRAKLQDYDFTESVYIKDAVETILGESVQWETVNWELKPNTIIFNQVSPIEIVATIVDSVKAIVTSNKDGSVAIKPIHPINTHEYFEYPVSHVIIDESQILELNEDYEYKDGYNKFRIIEYTEEFNNSLEWIEDENIYGRGIIRAYPSPWRTNLLLKHTRENKDISIYYDGISERNVSEELEVVDGECTTTYAIEDIVSVKWLSTPLNNISFSIADKIITFNKDVNGGYGVFIVTYKVISLNYIIEGVDIDVTQFILEEL